MLEAVAAIVRQYPGGIDGLDPGGTGFFVSPHGHLFTASHIFEEDWRVPYAACPSPHHMATLFQMPWDGIRMDSTADTALAKLDFRPNQHLRLASALPKPGAKVSVVGWDKSEGSRPHLTIGSIESTYLGHLDGFSDSSNPQYAPKRFPVLLTSPVLPAGFSGGPVLNGDGEVIGIHSAISDRLSVDGRAAMYSLHVSLEVLASFYRGLVK
jgi:S1-C subfamily serine protease